MRYGGDPGVGDPGGDPGVGDPGGVGGAGGVDQDPDARPHHQRPLLQGARQGLWGSHRRERLCLLC